MEVLDFEVPAEWQFAADAYPTAAKRLVSSLASGKKKSNKHISEERLEDVISKTVHLPSMAADAGKPNAEKGGLAAGKATMGLHYQSSHVQPCWSGLHACCTAWPAARTCAPTHVVPADA